MTACWTVQNSFAGHVRQLLITTTYMTSLVSRKSLSRSLTIVAFAFHGVSDQGRKIHMQRCMIECHVVGIHVVKNPVVVFSTYFALCVISESMKGPELVLLINKDCLLFL